LANPENIFYEHPKSSLGKNIELQEFTAIAIYLFMRAARALLCENPLKFCSAGVNDSEDRRIFSDLNKYQLYKSTDFISEQVARVQSHRQKGW
jgi:hypothetical protein